MTVFEKVQRWTSCIDPSDPHAPIDYNGLHEQIDFLEGKLYGEYEPTEGPHPDFHQRLSAWLNNTSDDHHQRLMFRLIPRLFFVGSSELRSLYRSAFQGAITRWLIDQCDIPISGASLPDELKRAVGATWFCPITDSMHIDTFYHVNRIEGRDHRPQWRTLGKFEHPDAVKDYVSGEGIERLVLLEDVVGSGSQIKTALEFAIQLGATLPTLVVPIIACGDGARYCRSLVGGSVNVQLAPVLVLDECVHIRSVPQRGEDELVPALRELALATYPMVANGEPASDTTKPYGPFGYRQMGCLFLTHSNCPNNTLPLVHWRSETWVPVFPRASRV